MKKTNLRLCREQRNLSLRQVADEIGIDHSTLALYETNKRSPSDSIKRKLADFYRETIGALFFNEGELKCQKKSKHC